MNRIHTDARFRGHLTPRLTLQCRSLPFYPCQLLSSPLCINVCFLLPFILLNRPFFSLSPGFTTYFPPRHHHFSLFLPPTGWAVKEERAHGRPLTTRNTPFELCCRGNDSKLFYTTSGTTRTNGISSPPACKQLQEIHQVNITPLFWWQ